ncbi:MAG TPA: hypothetical protein VKN99_14445 [Polyangia bacterium]|nr:hypothetical protein [Polyangia bacterium]
MRALLVALLVFAAACSRSAPASAPAPAPVRTVPPAGQPGPTAPLPQAGHFPEGQGKPCPAAGTCAAGMTCLRYRGLAGSERSTCEFPCAERGASCPEDQRCVTIADGPGRVCRPITDIAN